MKHNTSSNGSADKQRRNLALLALIVGLLIFGIKIYAFWITGSKAIFSDALESIVNVLTAVIALVVVVYSAQPRDKEHPYGHGKAEYFASAFEGLAIGSAGLLIVYEAVLAFFKPAELKHIDQGLLWVLGAGLANGALGLTLVIRGKKLHSPALVHDGHHLLTDFYTSLGVIVGLSLVKMTGWLWMDPLAALIVGSHLLFTASHILIKTKDVLMDAHDENLLITVLDLINKHAFAGIIRVHDTRIMRSGRFHHLDMHVVVPEFWTVEQAHEQANLFEEKVINDYPLDGEIHFHLDPCRRAYCRICQLENCPIRQQPFEKNIPFTLHELQSTDELPLDDLTKS